MLANELRSSRSDLLRVRLDEEIGRTLALRAALPIVPPGEEVWCDHPEASEIVASAAAELASVGVAEEVLALFRSRLAELADAAVRRVREDALEESSRLLIVANALAEFVRAQMLEARDREDVAAVEEAVDLYARIPVFDPSLNDAVYSAASWTDIRGRRRRQLLARLDELDRTESGMPWDEATSWQEVVAAMPADERGVVGRRLALAAYRWTQSDARSRP